MSTKPHRGERVPDAEVKSLADFVALYRGRTVAEAELVAVSAAPSLVRRFFTELLGEPEAKQATGNPGRATAVLKVVPSDEG